MPNKLEFKANKLSGIEMSNFAGSIILEVIKKQYGRLKFLIPWYALTLDLKTNKSDEWIKDKEYEAVSKNILAYISQEGLSYFEEIQKKITSESEEFKMTCENIIKYMPNKSDKELIKEYDNFIEDYTYKYSLGCVSFIYESFLSNKVSESLSKRYKNSTEIIENLLKSDYKSFMVESEELLNSILHQKDKSLIERYKVEFYFMKANYVDAPIITESILKEMKEDFKNEKIEETKLSNINLTKDEENIINLLKITEIIRDQRKKTNLIGSYTLFRFLDEVCKRKKIKRDIAKKIFWFEYAELFDNSVDFLKRLSKRKYVSFVLDSNKSYYLEYKAVKENRNLDLKMKEIHGNSASKGMKKGKAKIILGERDFYKISDGDIIVAEMTRPDFLPIMKKASAIITDEGGLTCHAAIISRELRIPCIVGTKIATKILKDGDLIEVDANKGIVRKL